MKNDRGTAPFPPVGYERFEILAPAELKKQVRLLAAETGLDMTAIVIAALRSYLNQQAKENPTPSHD